MQEQFADVILPLPLEGRFTYRIPKELISEIETGRRVIVQFGQRKFQTAIVSRVHNSAPENFEVKEIISVLDIAPVIFNKNILFWEWIAEYYCCTVGEVMKAALPSGMKLESLTKVEAVENIDFLLLNQTEKDLITLLENDPLSIKSIQKKLGSRFSLSLIKSLLEKKHLRVEEKIQAKYKPRTESFVSLSSVIKTENDLVIKTKELKKAPKQEGLLLHFCNLTNQFSKGHHKEISKKNLLKETGFSSAILSALVSKGILTIKQKTVSRLIENPEEQGELNLLNPKQEEALTKIKATYKNKQVILLHGVTSSGKTEIYTHLINEAINKGKQVLYLVPEIALTTQLINRLQRVFGKKVGVYHSRLNDSERVEIWEKVLNFDGSKNSSFQIILGTRSSVFLPFNHLGFIVVDEEHENTYKQFDPAPRYNARDLAVLLGVQNKINVLLGTATPSFETYYNVQSGKFGLVELLYRHGDLELPEVIISDLQKAYNRKQMKSFLAPELFNKIEESLEDKKQIILFQNRRGYSPFVECLKCGWVPKCNKCDVSLTYHKYKHQLTCHYCGYYMRFPGTCDDCGAPDLKTRGMGTEKIEDELKTLFPEARIARMDMDTTRSKYAFEKLVHNLENRKTDILVGTQMVTKGLDFEHVSVVGILNADNLLNFPDFRAHERSFQLISQVSGRAGRKHKQGTVIIQTSQPDHQIINEIKTQSFKQTFTRQLNERQLFSYPPFFRLVKIVIKHKDQGKLNRASEQLARELREIKKFNVLGPEFPLVSRIKLWHQKEIWVKIKRDKHLSMSKKTIAECIKKVSHFSDNGGTVFNIDVDPM